MANESSLEVVREIHIEAQPETVYAFFVDPDKMLRWMGTTATLDARPGGDLRIAINAGAIAAGRFVELDPPHRIVFTFGWDQPDHPIPPGSSTVEVELSPDGSGTRLRLCHRKLPADALADHSHGWDHFLSRLATVASGGNPGPDPWSAEPATEHTASRS